VAGYGRSSGRHAFQQSQIRALKWEVRSYAIRARTEALWPSSVAVPTARTSSPTDLVLWDTPPLTLVADAINSQPSAVNGVDPRRTDGESDKVDREAGIRGVLC
jgi:hypothetical protein